MPAAVDYDERMVEAVRKRGPHGAFAVQIADSVDCPVEEVKEGLEKAVEAGLVEHGRRMQLNGIMGDWWLYVAKPASEPQPAVADAGPKHAPEDGPLPPALTEQLTKPERAMQYLREHGKATTAELRVAMDIDSHHHPISYLRSRIKNGELHLGEFGYWALGPSPDAASEVPRRSAEAAKKPGPVTVIRPQAPQPVSPTAELDGTLSADEKRMLDEHRARTTIRPSDAVDVNGAGFACALWSNGELHIAQRGQPTVVLSPDAVKAMRAYLARF